MTHQPSMEKIRREALARLLARTGAVGLVLSLAIPMALPHGSTAKLYCYLASFVSIGILAVGAWKTRDGSSAKAAVDGGVLADPPTAPECTDTDIESLGDATD